MDVQFQEVDLEISRTLLVDKIPRSMCNKEDLKSHFNEAFPEAEVTDIQFAYDIKKLVTIHGTLTDTKYAKDYCQRHSDRSIRVYPVNCSRCCCCFCCCCQTRLEGLTYYTEEEARLKNEFKNEKEQVLMNPMGMIFITFKSVNMAKRVYDGFRKPFLGWKKAQPPTSSLSSKLR